MVEKVKSLKLKQWGNYLISSRGVHFYTEEGFKIFVPNRIIKQIEGMT